MGADARQQFIAIDGSAQPVIYAKFQPPQHARAIFQICDQENRHVARSLQRANLTAEPQRVVTCQTEADNNDVDAVLGGLEQGFLGIGLDNDGMMSREGLSQPL